MQQPQRWIWGLIPVAVIWLLAGGIQTGKIERDLSARAIAAMASKDVLSPQISVTGRDVAVSGLRLADNSADIVKAVGAQEGVRLVQDATKLIKFDARKDQNQLTLSGFCPDEKTRSDWLATVKSHFPGSQVADKLELAPGMPADFSNAVTFGLGLLSRLDTGALSVAGGKIGLTGVTLSEKAAQQIKDALASALPKGFAAASELTVKPALANKLDSATCQAQLVETNKRGRILFDTGDTTISEASYGLLDALVYVANNCAVQRIVVTGHTDSVGSADDNLALSKRRAQAVADYLIAAGIDKDRIEVAGLGQEKPIAPNDTEEGRAMNRRIEFTAE